MNYFEHHIGDYDKNTSHLSACEDGIYHRMLRRYYDKEKPLPVDMNEVKRLMRARTKDEKQAVEDILAEFFFLADDGWHNKVCDEAIEEYLAGEPEREAKKANEGNRLRKHREERALLFQALTGAGQHAPWNIGITELRALVERLGSSPATATTSATETQPATAPATLATATQTPIPNPQTPIVNTEDSFELLADSKPDLPVTEFSIPLVDGSEYSVLLQDFEGWVQAFPAVDVSQELRQMRVWVTANPTKRKTRRGVAAFIVRWLSKAQDNPKGRAAAFAPMPQEQAIV